LCYLIHLGIPAAYAERVDSPRPFRVARHRNPSVTAAFGPAFITFSVESGGCSCAIYSSPDAPRLDKAWPGKRRKYYEKLGWPEAKIQRALADAEATRTGHRHGVREDVAAFIAALAEGAGGVRLLVHDFRGQFGDEEIPHSRAHALTIAELRRGFPIAVDTVYTIR
jgi:hypothetical protein